MAIAARFSETTSWTPVEELGGDSSAHKRIKRTP
jgi:hypothetical protein